jgi:hypothetical protein
MIGDTFHMHATSVASRIFNRWETLAEEWQAYMKGNHPWANRTQDAENALYAKALMGEDAGRPVITLEAGYDLEHFDDSEPHGYWLEVAHGGEWAIVGPSSEAFRKQAREIAHEEMRR